MSRIRADMGWATQVLQMKRGDIRREMKKQNVDHWSELKVKVEADGRITVTKTEK